MTETKEAPGADLIKLLGDAALPASEVLGVVPMKTLTRAWAAGEVEFGRRRSALTGGVGKPGSQLVVEQGADANPSTWNWSGPKTPARKRLDELLAERPPDADSYRLYTLVPKDSEAKTPLVPLTRDEAHGLLAVHVRLTDKGLARLDPDD